VNGNGISWAICKSAPRSRQITTPAPHHSVFLQTGCPSCRPTNSVKALKAKDWTIYVVIIIIIILNAEVIDPTPDGGCLLAERREQRLQFSG